MSSWTPKAPRPAPSNTVGFVAWARANLFATKLDTALTLLAFTLVVYVVEAIFGWAIIDASFSGDDRTACLKTYAIWRFSRRDTRPPLTRLANTWQKMNFPGNQLFVTWTKSFQVV